jgi:8-oxo-dGTP pyrophosphatase MutT (NUDIX family)
MPRSSNLFYNIDEPRNKNAWFHAETVIPNERHVDAFVREMFEETGVSSTVGDLTLSSGSGVHVPLQDNKT